MSVVDRLFEAGYQRELWVDGLQRLADKIDVHGIITVPRISAENTVNLPVSRTLTDMATQFVEDGWYANDLRADRGWPMVDAGYPVVLEQDIISEDEHQRMPIYQELYRPYDILWWAGVTFKTTERQYTMSMTRRPEQGAFTETEREMFLELRLYLGKALSMAEMIGTTAAQAGIDVLEATGQAAVLVNGWGKVLAVTRQAEAMFSPEIMVMQGRLVVANGAVNRQLHRQLASALSSKILASGPIVLPRRNGRPVVMDVLPVPAANRADFLFAHAIVILADLDKRPAIDDRRLQLLFGLSPREVELVGLLANGASLTEAADRLMIGRETARTHLKSIFLKTDTSRQSHLLEIVRKAGGRS